MVVLKVSEGEISVPPVTSQRAVCVSTHCLNTVWHRMRRVLDHIFWINSVAVTSTMCHKSSEWHKWMSQAASEDEAPQARRKTKRCFFFVIPSAEERKTVARKCRWWQSSSTSHRWFFIKLKNTVWWITIWLNSCKSNGELSNKLVWI